MGTCEVQIMKKRKLISLTLAVALIIILLVTPVSAAGIRITGGGKITTTNGVTSPVITITDSEIAMNGTIIMNVSGLHEFVASSTLNTDNVIVSRYRYDMVGRRLW